MGEETPGADEGLTTESLPPPTLESSDAPPSGGNGKRRGRDGDGGREPGGPSEDTATFIEHLDELRTRIIRSLLYIVAGVALAFIVLQNQIITVILQPIQRIFDEHPDQGTLIVTGPAEMFFIWCKILLIGGIFLSIPFVLREIYGFVGPALTRQEKGYARWGFLFAPLLFATGVLFGYVVVPFGLRFLFNFTIQFGVAQFIKVGEYFNFFVTLMGGLGLVFQMPLIAAILTKLGIVDHRFLSAKRRYAIVILAVVAAIITPTPDLVNMSIVMAPMLALFEFSIVVSRVTGRGEREEREARPRQRRRKRMRDASDD